MNFIVASADFCCACFLLVILTSVLILKKNDKKYIFYLISIISLFVFSLFDGIAYLMDELGGNYTLHFASNLFSYIGIDIILSAFVYYVTEEIREYTNLSKIHARLALALCFLDFWIMVISSFLGKLFIITESGTSFGPFIHFVGITQFVVSIYFIILIFVYRKSLNRNLVITLETYFVVPTFFLLFELFVPSIEFTYLVSTIVMMIVYVAVVQKDIHTSVASEYVMRKASITDNLTGLFNRRAYAENISKLSTTYPKDFVYMSLDVNGLKNVNDTLGHVAGDEIIMAAAECMNKSFSIFGDIYRIGGDEFAAILYTPEEKFEKMIRNFENEVDSWKGKVADSLSISFGYVKASEVQGDSITSVTLLADKRMYESKSIYYRRKGVDRRGQQEAHVALCSLYTKILKINLTTDTFQIINMDTNEQTLDKGFANTISGWLTGFGKSGQVHEDDLEEYYQKTDIKFLRAYFNDNKSTINIFYRRKFPDGFKQVIMEMIPTNNYSSENQELFLYVKSIDK